MINEEIERKPMGIVQGIFKKQYDKSPDEKKSTLIIVKLQLRLLLITSVVVDLSIWCSLFRLKHLFVLNKPSRFLFCELNTYLSAHKFSQDPRICITHTILCEGVTY